MAPGIPPTPQTRAAIEAQAYAVAQTAAAQRREQFIQRHHCLISPWAYTRDQFNRLAQRALRENTYLEGRR
jgi:hypothetical protein